MKLEKLCKITESAVDALLHRAKANLRTERVL